LTQRQAYSLYIINHPMMIITRTLFHRRLESWPWLPVGDKTTNLLSFTRNAARKGLTKNGKQSYNFVDVEDLISRQEVGLTNSVCYATERRRRSRLKSAFYFHLLYFRFSFGLQNCELYLP